MSKPKIILADDHPLIMQGARQFLEQKGYQIMAVADNGNDAYLEILKFKPEIAIFDMDMPILTGMEVASLVRQNEIPTKVIILTLHKQEAILKEVGKKIAGYVTKDTALEELDNCIQKVRRGETYVSPKLSGNIFVQNPSISNVEITPTEIKILRLINDHLTSAEIAEQLFISKRTVEKHRSNIIRKLNLGSGHNDLLLWLKDQQGLFD